MDWPIPRCIFTVSRFETEPHLKLPTRIPGDFFNKDSYFSNWSLLNLFLNLTYYTYCLYFFFSIHHRILAAIFMSPSEPLTLSFALQFISKTCTQKILSIRYVIKVYLLNKTQLLNNSNCPKYYLLNPALTRIKNRLYQCQWPECDWKT